MAFGLSTLKKKFFKIEDVVEFDFFTLMNIVMLITEKHEEDSYYCYCNIYHDCCLYPIVRHFFRQRKPRFCALCKLQSFCYKKDAIEGMCVKEFLDRNSENKAKLNKLAELI